MDGYELARVYGWEEAWAGIGFYCFIVMVFVFFCFIVDRRLLLLKESRDGPMEWLGCAGIFC